MKPTSITECPQCHRMYHDDDISTCPGGHENHWDDEETAYHEHLRKVTW